MQLEKGVRTNYTNQERFCASCGRGPSSCGIVDVAGSIGENKPSPNHPQWTAYRGCCVTRRTSQMDEDVLFSWATDVYGVCMLLPYSIIHAPRSILPAELHQPRQTLWNPPTGLTIRSIRRAETEERFLTRRLLGALLQSSSPILAGSTVRNNAKPS